MASWAWSRAGAAPRSAHRAASPRCAHGLSAVPLQLLSGAEDSFVHVWKLSRSPDTDDVEVSETRASSGDPGQGHRGLLLSCWHHGSGLWGYTSCSEGSEC